MAKIYRNSDRIPVKIEGLEFKLRPLTFEQKSEIQSLVLGGDVAKSLESAKLAVKYGLAEVRGLQDSEGKEYEIITDEKGISEQSLDELLNLPQNEKLQMACLNLLKGIPDKFVNPYTGEEIEGVSVVKEKRSKKK